MILVSAATSLAAEPFLRLPIDCDLGTDCFIEDYKDADAGTGRQDYTCGPKSRDGHRGTDFALPDHAARLAGVPVIAAAPGLVEAIRDGEPDRLYDQTRHDLQGRNCGNAVRIRHDSGHMTLYCHLARGSVTVRQGQSVAAGTHLGLVGLSGETTFPHLHFSLLDQDGAHLDPFGEDPKSCGLAEAGFWIDPPRYEPTGFATAGFSNAVPSLDAVSTGIARRQTLRSTEPIVLYSSFFHAQPGDLLSFSAQGPSGQIFAYELVLDAPKVMQMQAYGKRAPSQGWKSGRYQGQLRLSRGNQLIGTRQAYVRVEN